ncbi:hypothetical protein D3C71_1342090 [compost metagenome]
MKGHQPLLVVTGQLFVLVENGLRLATLLFIHIACMNNCGLSNQRDSFFRQTVEVVFLIEGEVLLELLDIFG